MKKFVSGLIVGAMLFAGASAFADSASLIGQKVQGLFTVEKNGAKVADAVIISGTAYAPVRAVSDATGAKLTIEGKKIIMGDSSNNATSTNEAKTLTDLKSQHNKISTDLNKHQERITDLENNIIPIQEEAAKLQPKLHQEQLDQYKQILQQTKAEVASLQQQLTDIDAQIKALENASK
ncbi:hypothetical protein GCM10010912_17500 [Paenibacillus albidus]|uniref:Copper amine oxidase n=1 Tax=Paenibacillus albidus TaxID=2041023 RepID=A0A917C5H1_9BACL|nr:hypothetical protein [Paenibacillus albidus]GGF72782.1 hypothetical protein GCM10010912_17500 [Paenibacillus albidus]